MVKGNEARYSRASFYNVESVSVQLILAFGFRFQDLSVREIPAVGQVSVDVTEFVVTICVFST